MVLRKGISEKLSLFGWTGVGECAQRCEIVVLFNPEHKVGLLNIYYSHPTGMRL